MTSASSSRAQDSASTDQDPFDTLLDLESTYEAQGYADGLRDGKAQALSSARLFGIEQGFEKYIVMSRLRYRVETWAAKLSVPLHTKAEESQSNSSGKEPSRMGKHIVTLLALTDPATLDYANTDEAVGDFEERLRKAQAKCKLVERILGTNAAKTDSTGQQSASGEAKQPRSVGDGDIEDPRLNMAALRLASGRDG